MKCRSNVCLEELSEVLHSGTGLWVKTCPPSPPENEKDFLFIGNTYAPGLIFSDLQ